ncbi:MAG: DedA family protein [Ignavibacteriales bacterium]|nr:DedA family protein [Ignavibacteriales bacterium]
MEHLVERLLDLNPFLIYAVVASIAFIENILPPFPSDVAVVAAGSLVGLGTIGLIPLLAVTTVASTLGFITMYFIGLWFGRRILEQGKIKFLPLESVHRVESWFRIYGYWVIAGNRFLAGTRAVVSFFAGISELSITKTTMLSFVSALAWNSILILSGKALGENWSSLAGYLETYSKAVTGIIVAILAIVLIRFLWRRKRSKIATAPKEPKK